MTSAAQTIPGMVVRPYAGEADVAHFVRIANAEFEADGITERYSLGDELAYFGSPSEQFDPARDAVVAELDGQAIAVATQEWIETRDGEFREYRLWGAVDPAFRRRGIGTALLRDNEERARRLAASHAKDRTPVFASWSAHGRPASVLLERHGYEIARWFLDMVRPTLEDLPSAPPLPDGLELRAATPDLYPAIWRANREAFRDHWGGSDESEAAMHRFLDSPDVDPSLWLIAWDAEEIAGGVINGIRPAENEALGVRRGWLESVFTRRQWRRRGLARALIAWSLAVLRDRGMTSAALGVDADNPTGALGLYEEAGFRVAERFTAWRKPMDRGVG